MPNYWHPRLAEVLAGPHRDEWRLSAHHDDLPDDRLDLPISRLQVTYDDNRAPYVQLRADVVAPSDPALDAILDPRLGVRLHAHYGVECRRDESPGSVAGRVNRAWNPSVQVNPNAWAFNAGIGATATAARVTGGLAAGFPVDTYYRGTIATVTSGTSTSTGVLLGALSNDYVNVVGGQPVTFSIYAHSSRAGHIGYLLATWADSAGVAVGGLTQAPVEQWRDISGPGPVRLSWTTTPPVGATRALLRTYITSGCPPWQVGDTFAAGALLVEDGATLRPYFDGNAPGVTPRFGGPTYAWTGTVGASPSVQTIHTPGPIVAEPTLLADLALRLRGSILPTRVVALDASSDESLVIDNAPSSVLTGLASNSSRGHIQSVITTALGAAPAFVVNAPSDAAFTVPAGASTDKWDTVQDMADGLGDIRVFDDGYRTWWLDPQPVLAADADLALVDGVNGTVVVRDSQVDREPWYNRVVLVYRWTSGGVENIIQSVRSITSGPYQATAGNTKAYREERSTAATQARADQAATSMVRRKSTLGRGLRVRCVAVPWFRPGLTVSITDATGTARHLAASVVFDRAGYMEFTTRYADSTETIGA